MKILDPRVLEARRLIGSRAAIARAAGAVLVLALMLFSCEPEVEQRLLELQELQERGRHEETIEPLSELLDRRPDDLELNRLYGIALFVSESPGLAIWPLRKASEHPAHTVRDVFLLAQALARGGARDESIAAANRVLEVEREHLDALLLRTRLELELKSYADVLVDVDRILDLDPKRPYVHVWRAKALAGLERFDDADTAIKAGWAAVGRLSDAVTLEQELCSASIEIANGRGDRQQTEERWEACLKRWPTSVELIQGAVEFFDERAKSERGTELLERALELEPAQIALRTMLARRLEDRGHAQEAEKLLRDATGINGGMPAAWLALADLYRDRGDYAAAVRATEHVLLLRETVPILVLAQFVDDLVQAREFEKAEQAVELVPKPEYAALLRGRLLLARGEPTAALEELEKGLRLWPGNSAARWLAGQAAEQLGDFDRAIAEYRTSIRGDVENSDGVFALSSLLADEGKYTSAIYVLALRTDKLPRDRRANAEVARIATAAGLYEIANDAVERLRQEPRQQIVAATAAAAIVASREGPAAAVARIERDGIDLRRSENAELLRALVRYQIEAHREVEALRRSRAAVEAAPDVAAFHEIHGLALNAAGHDADEVRAAYRRALTLDSESADTLTGLARLEARVGRVADAIALYDRASEIDPEDAEPAAAAIELLATSGRDAEIDERLENLLQRHPRHASTASLLARRLLARGSDLDRANDLAKRAVRFRGGADALEVRGLVAAARGDSQRAIRLLRLSLKLRPSSPSTLYQLARVLTAAGDRSGAIVALRDALAIGAFPEQEAAREELARLESEAESANG